MANHFHYLNFFFCSFLPLAQVFFPSHSTVTQHLAKFKEKLQKTCGFGWGWKSKEQEHPFEQHPSIKLIRCSITPYPWSRVTLSNLPPILGGSTLLFQWECALKNDLHLSNSDDCYFTKELSAHGWQCWQPTQPPVSLCQRQSPEMSMLGDRICFTTTALLIQSHKEELLS